MNSQKTKEWHIKLRVSHEEERKIKKEAIDNDMRIADYVKQKLLGSSSGKENLAQRKSA